MNLGKKEYNVTKKKPRQFGVHEKKWGGGGGVKMYLLTKFCNCLREEKLKGRKKNFHFDLTLILHILTKSNFLTSCSREKVELRKKIYRQCICIACCLREQFE